MYYVWGLNLTYTLTSWLYESMMHQPVYGIIGLHRLGFIGTNNPNIPEYFGC